MKSRQLYLVHLRQPAAAQQSDACCRLLGSMSILDQLFLRPYIPLSRAWLAKPSVEGEAREEMQRRAGPLLFSPATNAAGHMLDVLTLHLLCQSLFPLSSVRLDDASLRERGWEAEANEPRVRERARRGPRGPVSSSYVVPERPRVLILLSRAQLLLSNSRSPTLPLALNTPPSVTSSRRNFIQLHIHPS